MQSLEDEVKQLIIDSLQLEDMTPADIDADAPLFVEGLGLDSIDALELGVALQKRYGIHLSADSEETRKHFSSVSSLAALIASHKQ
ncbi:phosphopantetheine-binding protein [Chitinivorax sp. B]|uniref:phosphopantetheine-binding protein n=1 Tax=Chitinivorax sp. B TaxID=2502235 RepID=UPI0010F88D8C|nr:phosphopantetheine-binding protein [Chitinivorax sp. B]